MFVRKLAGTAGVALAMFVLGQRGFGQGETQPPEAVAAIRWLAALAPALLLLYSAWLARGYPLTRAAHGRILEQLAARPADQAKEARSASSISARTAG
jgi:Na+/melibiose symporter-like transporter